MYPLTAVLFFPPRDHDIQQLNEGSGVHARCVYTVFMPFLPCVSFVIGVFVP